MTAARLTTGVHRTLVLVLALASLSGCVSVGYQRPGQTITPRDGKTLVFGRLRFFHDGREFFPWSLVVRPPGLGVNTERHVWLLRLGRRAVSAEIHPEEDGSLAIWLDGGDYALLGSTEPIAAATQVYEVMGLLRVPAGPVAAYAGELIMQTETHEGWYASSGEMGRKSVDVLPVGIAQAALERTLGILPEPAVVAAWCTGDFLPGFKDPELAKRGQSLLDHDCNDAH